MRELFQHHGLLDDISDRAHNSYLSFGNIYVQRSKSLASSHQAITHKLIGKTKRINQTLEQYLWYFINYQQDVWVTVLHFAEFAYNNSVHASTKVTTFFA